MLPSVFPLEVFLLRRCTSPVVLLQRRVSCKLPAPLRSIPLQAISRLLVPLHPSPSPGLQWDRMLAAVLTAPCTISHNWHHAIITSHQSNPAIPLLMSDSGPNRAPRSHICHATHIHTHVHTHADWKTKKQLACGNTGYWIMVISEQSEHKCI